MHRPLILTPQAYEAAMEFILGRIAELETEDYAFTVVAEGAPWDVYRFRYKGSMGTLALRIVKGNLEVGYCRKGKATEEQVRKVLFLDAPS